MVELSDLIKVYDNVVEPQYCQYLIELFESNHELHDRVENNRTPNFTQLNLTEFSNQNSDLEFIHNYFIKKTFEYKKDYYKFVDERCFPGEHAFEQFRIKRYINNGDDAFDCHVDVMDHPSAKRFLAFLWYLNDVDNGGETVFDDIVIKPQVGKLIVFPPMWMFPHIGKPPISNNKYILSTYLHYK